MNKQQKLAVLNLFNKALLEQEKYNEYYIKELLKFGIVCNSHCDVEVIWQYANNKKFNPNTTFYQTIKDVAKRTRWELLSDQLLHYYSTYGTNFQGQPFIINNNPVNISGTVFIDTITEEEVLERCQNMLYSGIALSQETIKSILAILGNNFDINRIKNKEALCIIAAAKNIYPQNAEDIVRVLVYKATQKSLLIKNRETLKLISQSTTIIPIELAETLSAVFYRFKDIFISFKKNPLNKHTVNIIRKLANKNHTPFVLAFWSNVLSSPKELKIIGKRAAELNNFKKIALLNTILVRLHNNTNIKPYIIRNGKLWVEMNEENNKQDKYVIKKGKELRVEVETGEENDEQSKQAIYLVQIFNILYQSLILAIGKNRCEIVLPDNLVVAAPTSEKNFMGEIPLYSYVRLRHDAIIGINWKEADGANDLDLSMIDNTGGKIGWNADFYTKDKNKTFIYSGDMTSANPEATEILYRKEKSDIEGIVNVNSYDLTKDEAKYKVFFAEEKIEKKLEKNYMVNPQNIIYQYETSIGQGGKQIGIFVDNKFIFANLKTSNKRVSEKSITDLQLVYLKQIHGNLLTLQQILTDAGFTVTKSRDAVLSKDTVIKCLY